MKMMKEIFDEDDLERGVTILTAHTYFFYTLRITLIIKLGSYDKNKDVINKNVL